MRIFMKTPAQKNELVSATKISLKITGFSRQKAIPVEDIVRSIDTLPPAHLAGLREIAYAPELAPAHPQSGNANTSHRQIKAKFNQGQSRIDIYSFDNSAMFFHILFHEIGHFVYFRALNSQARKEWITRVFPESSSVSGYGETNAIEDFAETYGVFLRDPERLQQQLPEKYRFMKHRVFYPKS